MYWRGILVPPCDRNWNWNWNWRSGIGIGIGIVSSGIGIGIGIVKSGNAGIGIGIGIAKSELTPALLWRLSHWPLGDLTVILKIFNLALVIGIFKSSYDNVLRWIPQDLPGDKSTLVQVMAWCGQATSHYLNQCWPRSPAPYGVTRPQWVVLVPMPWFCLCEIF